MPNRFAFALRTGPKTAAMPEEFEAGSAAQIRGELDGSMKQANG